MKDFIYLKLKNNEIIFNLFNSLKKLVNKMDKSKGMS